MLCGQRKVHEDVVDGECLGFEEKTSCTKVSSEKPKRKFAEFSSAMMWERIVNIAQVLRTYEQFEVGKLLEVREKCDG